MGESLAQFVTLNLFTCTFSIRYYKQVRPSAALASRRALRPAINGRPQCSIPSTILSLHKCAYRATSRLSVVLSIKFKFNPIF